MSLTKDEKFAYLYLYTKRNSLNFKIAKSCDIEHCLVYREIYGSNRRLKNVLYFYTDDLMDLFEEYSCVEDINEKDYKSLLNNSKYTYFVEVKNECIIDIEKVDIEEEYQR